MDKDKEQHLANNQQSTAAAPAPAGVVRKVSRVPASPTPLRLQFYATYFTLLLLKHGKAHVAQVLRLLASASLTVRKWASEKYPDAQRLLLQALCRLRALLGQVGRPLGRLLGQLLSLQVRLTTNDDLEPDIKLSARLHCVLAMLFGAVRLRSHSCLQLSLPSQQRHLQPEISLSSPCASQASSPVKARLLAQQATQQQPQQKRQGSPTRRSGLLRSLQQQPQQQPQQVRAADAEVHVLCSVELKTAIMAFLQHHSSTIGQEFVLLTGSRPAGRQPGAPAGLSVDVGCAATATAPEAHASAAQQPPEATTPGGSSRVRQSRQLFQGLTDGSSPRSSCARHTNSSSISGCQHAAAMRSSFQGELAGFVPFNVKQPSPAHSVNTWGQALSAAGIAAQACMAAAEESGSLQRRQQRRSQSADGSPLHLSAAITALAAAQRTGDKWQGTGLDGCFAAAAGEADGAVAVSIAEPLDGIHSPSLIKAAGPATAPGQQPGTVEHPLMPDALPGSSCSPTSAVPSTAAARQSAAALLGLAADPCSQSLMSLSQQRAGSCRSSGSCSTLHHQHGQHLAAAAVVVSDQAQPAQGPSRDVSVTPKAGSPVVTLSAKKRLPSPFAALAATALPSDTAWPSSEE